ncbi:MAG: alpha/beta fold hydrolase [Myxococcota bacterium]
MSTTIVNGVRLALLDTGGTGPTVCFSHGLLWDHRMFRPQIDALRDRYRCVAWDHRAQGQSEVPPGRIATIEEVTADAIALIERLGVGPVHFVGLSMGGFVGIRIAARRPELVRSLSLLETAADPEPAANIPKYRRLAWVARLFGVRRWLADRVLAIMCGGSFLADPQNAARVDVLRSMLMENRRSVVKAVAGVLERDGVEGELGRIACPTLVLRGTEDAAITRDRAHRVVEQVAGAQWVEVPGAGHTSTLEAPEAVTAALIRFLSEVDARTAATTEPG